MGTLNRTDAHPELANDERWRLVQRIVASAAFQKSVRLRDLLLFVSERALGGHAGELTEQRIGQAVFSKGLDFVPLEDSSVRVNARQLRLKLHEYFDTVGREEPIVLELPKGSYIPIFRPADRSFPGGETGRGSPLTARLGISPVALGLGAGALCLVLLALGYWMGKSSAGQPPASFGPPPWPLSRVIDETHRTHVIVADVNYGMLRIMTRQPGSLEQYLTPEFPQSFIPQVKPGQDPRIVEYITRSTLTSFADVSVVSAILKLAGPLSKRISIRSARDFRMRDFREGNYIFIGSPGSNPWVSLFEQELNFWETEAVVGEGPKAFVNKRPATGEQARYQGLAWTGNAGEDYATIALLPNELQRGNVLILQGLQQEGTEAAGLFLASEGGRRKLREALGLTANEGDRAWFEVLIRTKAVAGATSTTDIVVSRSVRQR